MGTFKYYKIKVGVDIPQIEGIDIYDYHEINGCKIIGVNAPNHTQFENSVEVTEQTFEEVEPILIQCHFYSQLNSDELKIKYGLKQQTKKGVKQ